MLPIFCVGVRSHFAIMQTINSIVPVMVSSLKRTRSKSLELYLTSRDFLRVFTDASNHVPRHRRIRFVGKISKIWQNHNLPQLLYSPCRRPRRWWLSSAHMHAPNREGCKPCCSAKFRWGERCFFTAYVNTSLCPTGHAIQRSSPPLPHFIMPWRLMQTLTEILRECQRLAARVIDPTIIQPIFLDVSP